ncbi:MAG TPA: hypothetical protein VFN46_07465 [Acetobacteraceae bacterium]|nr:hypothetical protein [Acetobacteraceae bacterium]
MALAMGGCAAVGDPQPIASVQPGDSALTCNQLAAQMAEMDRIMAGGTAGTAATVANAASDTASTAAGYLSNMGNVLGSGAQVAALVGSTAASGQQSQAQMAQQRKQVLMNRYTAKKC